METATLLLYHIMYYFACHFSYFRQDIWYVFCILCVSAQRIAHLTKVHFRVNLITRIFFIHTSHMDVMIYPQTPRKKEAL